ncbi:TerD family protein [Alkaliphilus sp. B6464]|uniref:TerD family protein n=1 Tax=Alkaliphilus sp. B6464 TaxID=2731219 RepID=UPI001BA82597|nr:TerD family protein [Alkaliphilus sp. B6464]QUH22233.1 TerD family protein [Alkaliphilus sp. B6464]
MSPYLSKGRGLSLTKDQSISLSKIDVNLKNLLVGLGWDVNTHKMNNAYGSRGNNFDHDLDVQVFIFDSLNPNQRVISDGHFIFYNQPLSPDGAVRHTGDNRNGQGEGDDESVLIDLLRISPQVQRLLFTVTIHDANIRDQHFGQINNAYIRVVNRDTGIEVIRYDLTSNYSGSTSLIVGEMIRIGNDWQFKALGQGTQEELFHLCRRFGVNIS